MSIVLKLKLKSSFKMRGPKGKGNSASSVTQILLKAVPRPPYQNGPSNQVPFIFAAPLYGVVTAG